MDEEPGRRGEREKVVCAGGPAIEREGSSNALHGITFPEQQLAEFCRRHRVRRLSLFGSVLRDDFGPDSDVDVLVEFEEGWPPGMIGFGGMILELSALFGRRVDLRTPFDLSRHLRPDVLRESRTLHAA